MMKILLFIINSYLFILSSADFKIFMKKSEGIFPHFLTYFTFNRSIHRLVSRWSYRSRTNH